MAQRQQPEASENLGECIPSPHPRPTTALLQSLAPGVQHGPRTRGAWRCDARLALHALTAGAGLIPRTHPHHRGCARLAVSPALLTVTYVFGLICHPCPGLFIGTRAIASSVMGKRRAVSPTATSVSSWERAWVRSCCRQPGASALLIVLARGDRMPDGPGAAPT